MNIGGIGKVIEKIVMISIFVALGGATVLFIAGVIHDLAFSNIVTKQEVYELKDVQGLDDDKFLYKFGNKAFGYERIGEIEVGKNYTVTFSKCLNCWLFDDNKWGIENIEG